MQRRTVLILSLALAFAVAAFVWSRGAAIDAPPLGGSAANGPAPSPGPAPEQVPAVSPPSQPAPPGAPRVHVDVVLRERYVAPSPVRVVAVRAGDQRELPATLLAGAGAGFDASPLAAGNALAAIDLADGRVVRQVALAAGASTTVRVGARIVVQGTVVDAQKRPVRDARVWFGEFDGDGNWREAALEDGVFTAEVASSDGVPFVARAPGHASQWRVLTVHGPIAPLEMVLEKACALDVQIAAVADAMAPARVFVVPRGSISTALAQWPFFAQALTQGYALGATGGVSIPDLPVGGEVGVLVVHPRGTASAPLDVVLKGERVRAIVPLEVVPTAWQGTVADEAGTPLSGVAVWSRGGAGPLTPGSSQRLLPPHLDARDGLRTWTAEDGTFAIGAPVRGDRTLSLRAPGYAGRDLAWSASPPSSFVLPRWIGGEPELRLAPPRAGSAWVAEANLAGGVREVLAADAVWRVSLPHAGRFDFVLTTWLGEQRRAEERHAGLHVTGAIELSAPRIP